MRSITMDFRAGGGSPSEFLFGKLTVYGTEQAANGSGWVVTSKTTLELVNGQATLTNALERPTDGSLGHYHFLVRDKLSPRGASFRKYLPTGASPVNLVDLPDAWDSM